MIKIEKRCVEYIVHSFKNPNSYNIGCSFLVTTIYVASLFAMTGVDVLVGLKVRPTDALYSKSRAHMWGRCRGGTYTNNPIAAMSMMPVASQPRIVIQRGRRKRPMTFVLWLISIIITMIGTATTPLMTAA